MNKNIRNFVKGIARNSEIFFSGLVGSVTSFLRIIVLSKCRTSLETRHYSNLKEHKSCIILANGPSLKKALDSGDVIYQDRDVFCLNLLRELFIVNFLFFKLFVFVIPLILVSLSMFLLVVTGFNNIKLLLYDI